MFYHKASHVVAFPTPTTYDSIQFY